jgi:hypothetical protein
MKRAPSNIVQVLAAISLVFECCAPLSPNAKYLFAPEVRTCPPLLDDHSSRDDPNCWARVKEPIPKKEQVSGACFDPGLTSNNTNTTINLTLDTVTVRQATNYADQIEEEYVGAKAEYGSIPAAAGALLVPAATSAMALGSLGESATAVTSLGFGSAGVLGGAYLLSNPPREKAYMAGADALECLTSVMRPFDIEQGSLTIGQLCQLNSQLYANKAQLQDQIGNFAQELVQYQTEASTPYSQATRKKLCYAEKLLKAASTSLQAATSAYDAGTKYVNYSYDNAGNEMVDSVNTINNKVNEAMITTEPDLHALANNLSTVIPQSAQKLAGIDKNAAASKAAVEKAAVALNQAQAAASKPQKGEVSFPIDSEASVLNQKINATNNAAELVVNRSPSEIIPKIKDCSKGFNQPGAPPDVLTLNPDGDIPLSQGDSQKVEISGGKLPYFVHLLCECFGDGVTAQTTYEDSKATITIRASDIAKTHTYPLMVTDATGIGRPLNIVVSSKATTSADTPDCAEPKSKPTPTARHASIYRIGIARVADL